MIARRRAGFTLIELLVVIAIIAVLIGLLLPAVQKVREAAARSQCQNNMKQIGVAIHNYHGSAGVFPPSSTPDIAPWKTPTTAADANWGSSWMVHILSFMEQGNLNIQWQFSGQSGWQVANNNALIKGLTIPSYRCPSTSLPDRNPYSGTLPGAGGVGIMYTTYVAISGSSLDVGVKTFATNLVSDKGVLIHQSKTAPNGVRLTDITDGASNTLMVGEQSNHLRNSGGAIIQGGAYGGPSPIAVTCAGPDGWIQGCTINTPTGNVTNSDVVYNSATIRYPINQPAPQTGTGAPTSGGMHDNVGNNIPLSSMHPGGCNLLFADGSVRFWPSSTPFDPILRYAACRNDGQTYTMP